MGLTLHLFDSRMRMRETILKGISECIHDEGAHTLTAEIPASHKACVGEFLGLMCVDGRFRAFEITNAVDDEARDVTEISSTDAAIAELAGTLCDVHLENATAQEATGAVLAGTDWQLGRVTAGTEKTPVNAYFGTRWETLRSIADACGVWIEPYYEIDDDGVVGRYVDVLAREPVYRGRFIQQGWDADSVQILHGEAPRPKIYPLGAVISTESGRAERLTIADVEWSVAKGDPVDKPKGQKWIGDPAALAKYPRREKKLERDDITDADALCAAAWKEAQASAVPKVVAQAQVSDLETDDRQSWKKLRQHDLICVGARHREPVYTQILRIERNYVRGNLTRVTMGDEEPPSLIRRVAKLSQTSESTRQTVSSHGYGISQTAAKLQETDIQVTENMTRIGEVSIGLDAANAQIALRATRTELSQAERRISEAEVAIDAANAEIALKASLEVTQGIEKRVSSAEVRISGAEAEIDLKVNKDGVISAINVSSESVTIKSSKINLNGYVTASQLEAELADFDLGLADFFKTHTLYAEYANLDYLNLDGSGATWKEQTVVTGITKPILAGQRIWYKDQNGDTQNLWVVTGWSTQLSYSTEDLAYVGD